MGDGKQRGGNNGKPVSEMSEEEMLKMALAASLDTSATALSEDAYELTDEPAEGAPDAVKIQFRLPDGTRAVRRFSESDQVGVIYAFVASKCSKQTVELRAGFPPKDICSKKEATIADSKLAGEMIHGRYV